MRVTTRREKRKISAMPGVETSSVQTVNVIICMQRRKKPTIKKKPYKTHVLTRPKGKRNCSNCR